MAEKNAHKGHRQRMRDKYLEHGIESFKEHEALELFLFYGVPYKNTNPLAHKLIEDFGSLSAIFDAPPSLLREYGLSDNLITHIKLMPDMARLYMIDKADNPAKAIDMGNLCRYFQPLFFGKTEEVMRILLLDKKGKEIYSGIISKGSINSTDVNIRKICELALYYNAKYAAIAHNHPSGLAKPSPEDLDCTGKIFVALQLISVKLLDHVIVADDDSVSMALSGYGIFSKDVNNLFRKILDN
ncbi:MAG: hypothetical protein K6F88_06470 [Ruminococcus sp.]|nr:hypothetical protein [Ruminococcus sp.]